MFHSSTIFLNYNIFKYFDAGGKNSADRSLLIDLMYWVSQNPPPAHLFLISGDKDFAGILHRLRMNNYNILLASPPGKASDVLCSAATIMWHWSSLLKGEDLIGKHFNHPPDGLFGSWYGNSKAPLQNPFSAAEQSTSLQNAEIHKPSSDVKLGPIPNSVVKKIRHILNSHPNGISITDLRAELTKNHVHLDKNLYGYKKFSQFLLAIPHIGDGNFLVRLVSSESPAPCESINLPSTTSVVKNDERGYAATTVLNGEGKNRDRYAHVPLFERGMEEDSKSLHPVSSQGKPIREYIEEKSSSPSFVERHVLKPLGSKKVVDVANASLSDIQLPPKDSEVSKTKTGFFNRSKTLPDNATVRSEDASPKILGKYTISGNHSAGDNHTTLENNDVGNHEAGKFKAMSENENPTRKEVDEVCRSYSLPAVDDSQVEKRPDGSAETYRKSSTFFSWIRSWWPFGKNSADSDDLTANQDKVVSNSEDLEETKPSDPDHDVIQSGKPELFSSGSFWSDMESFVFTPKGSLLLSQSKSRLECIIVLHLSYFLFCYGIWIVINFWPPYVHSFLVLI